MLAERAEATGRPPEQTDRIFLSPGGKTLTDSATWKIINFARLAAGLDHIRPYDLRRSHIELGAHP